MQRQIRISALVLSLFMSLGVVAGIIALRPPLTQTYYVQLGALIAGAGLVVTLFNALLTMRARRRQHARTAQEEALAALSAPAPLVEHPAYAATQEAAPPAAAVTHPVARPAVALVQDAPLPESLDALLDVAYEAAEEDPVRAVAAYRRALARYPEDSYMPYLIIELSTLYKRLGEYEAALALFDEALALPRIAQNAVMVQEFERSRRVLTVVSHMLAAQGTPRLPFGDVPKEILAEADRRADEHKESLIK